MSAIAQDPKKLRELEDRTRRAWKAYRTRLQGLSGEEYERVEHDSWAELQRELRRLERQRKLLTQT